MAMTEGLLWFQPDGDMWRAIDEAARRYHQKYDRWPNRCYLNSQDWLGVGRPSIYFMQTQDDQGDTYCVLIKISSVENYVHMSHLWIGVDDRS